MRLSGPEWKVMEVVRERGRATAAEVLEALEGDAVGSRSDIEAILARLVEKGAVAPAPETQPEARPATRAKTAAAQGSAADRPPAYVPVLSAEEARRAALRSLVAGAFRGPMGPLVHFMVSKEHLAGGDDEEIREVLARELLEAAEKDGPRASPASEDAGSAPLAANDTADADDPEPGGGTPPS